MKELKLTKEQKKLLKKKGINFPTATFLEEMKLFKLTSSLGGVCYYTADLSGYTNWTKDIEVVNGYVKLTNLDGYVCYYRADLSKCTDWVRAMEVVDGYVKVTSSEGYVCYYTADLGECTGRIFGKHSTEVIDGELKITPIITTITLKNN